MYLHNIHINDANYNNQCFLNYAQKIKTQYDAKRQ